jgi:hypothetical protein
MEHLIMIPIQIIKHRTYEAEFNKNYEANIWKYADGTVNQGN